MIQNIRGVAILATLSLSLPWLPACSDGSSVSAPAHQKAAGGITSTPERRAGEPMDVIARVGGQTITFSEINTMLNSAAIVGLSMPELGSPERDTVRITLLDKLISANLLYLDAVKNNVNHSPEYQLTVEQFKDAILANLYRSKVLVGEVEVTDEDVQAYYKDNIVAGTELTDELRTGIEATIRKNRVKQRTSTMRERLRKGHRSVIKVSDLDPAEDQIRSGDDVLAELDGVPITWSEIRPALQKARTMNSTNARIDAIDRIIDNRIMSQKAKEVGLEQDPVYQARFNEFTKTRLINIHRGQLVDSWSPTEEELKAYYDANEERILIKEVRKLQMLVVKTEKEADDLKKQIEANQITFHKAVADHSIIADANKTLGQIGWVTEGTGFPELDKETFMLDAGEIGGPVQSPAGWHLVRVLDQRDALHTNINDEQTRTKTRRLYLEEKLNLYVISLRKQDHPVEVNEEMISKLSQQEIDWYQDKLKNSQKSPEQVLEEIQRLKRSAK